MQNDTVRDDLPPYVFKSKEKLFMGVWHDTTESPCLEIVEEMFEPIDDVFITHAIEQNELSKCFDSTKVKLTSVDDYVRYLINWTLLNCL